MAIVKTDSVFVDGQSVRRKVKCSSDGLFTCDLPDYIRDALGRTNHNSPAGRSLDDCLAVWSDCCRQYEARTDEKTDVIGFSIDTDVSFAKGVVLGVSAEAYTEVTTTHRDGRKTYNYSRLRTSGMPHRLSVSCSTPYDKARMKNQIPFTPENVAFFNDLNDSMMMLIDKLKSISESPDTMLEFIDRGVRLLPNPKGD